MRKILFLALIICLCTCKKVYSYAEKNTFFYTDGYNVFSSDGEFYIRCGNMLKTQNGEIYYIYTNCVLSEEGTIYFLQGEIDDDE